jgi:uncharacterized protein (TIRG00374 family)
MTESQRKAKRWKTILTIVTILALVGLAFAVREQLINTLKRLPEVNIWWVLMIFPIEALHHLTQAKIYQGLFRIFGERFRTRSMFRLSLELNFVNSVFPSAGVSGFSYISYRLKSEKISTGQASLVQLMRFVLIFISFQVLLFVGLAALAIGGQANDVILLLAGSLATLVLVGTIVLTFIVGAQNRIDWFFTNTTKLVNKLIHIFRPKNPETISLAKVKRVVVELHENYMQIRRNLTVLKMPLFYSLLASMTEIAAIYVVYIAFGTLVNPGAVILAYAIANFAGLIAVLPGGVGIYEGLMTAVLAAGGVPLALGLPVTVMFRVVNMIAQLPPGYYFYQKNLHADSKMQEVMESLKHDDRIA